MSILWDEIDKEEEPSINQKVAKSFLADKEKEPPYSEIQRRVRGEELEYDPGFATPEEEAAAEEKVGPDIRRPAELAESLDVNVPKILHEEGPLTGYRLQETPGGRSFLPERGNTDLGGVSSEWPMRPDNLRQKQEQAGDIVQRVNGPLTPGQAVQTLHTPFENLLSGEPMPDVPLGSITVDDRNRQRVNTDYGTEERHCTQCNALLSRYNSGPTCRHH